MKFSDNSNNRGGSTGFLIFISLVMVLLLILFVPSANAIQGL